MDATLLIRLLLLCTVVNKFCRISYNPIIVC